MQEPESKKEETVLNIDENLRSMIDRGDDLYHQVQSLTEENESLIEDLAKSDAALENQKADLWKLIEEARESARQQKQYLVSSENIYSKMKQSDEEEIQTLRQEKSELNCGLNTANIVTDDLRQEVKALRTENEALNQENEELSIDLVRLNEELDMAGRKIAIYELAREGAQVAVETRTTPANQPLFPHYYRAVPRNTTHVDVYWILKAWDVVDPCVQHAVKKLLAAGRRGAKDSIKDLNEARDSITRAIELEGTE
jgi:chromosome segregation ATPase